MTSPDSPFTIKRTDEWEEEEAIKIFKQQPSKNTSYVDCTNIVLMKQGNLAAIFSFDKVYRKNHLPFVEDLLTTAPAEPEAQEEEAA